MKKKKNNTNYLILAKVAGRIILPLLMLVIVGILIDEALGNGHLFMFLFLGFSLFTTVGAVFYTLKKEGAR